MVGKDGPAEGAREAAAGQRALGARAIAGVRAAPRTALSGVGREPSLEEHETLQVRLVPACGAAHAAALRHRYEVCSTGSSRASSAGTSTGLGTPPAPASASIAGMMSPGWSASA